jgi:hypothetical protein
MRLQMRLVTYKYRVTRTFEKDARFHASAWCEALSKIMMILSVNWIQRAYIHIETAFGSSEDWDRERTPQYFIRWRNNS